MVSLLLDTHTLLWALGDVERLAPRVRALLADRANDVVVSMASVWEVTLKARYGKLGIGAAEVLPALGPVGFRLLPITPAHLLALAALPVVPGHRDPFDHLLIAQAIAEGLVLVSADAEVPRYPVPVLTPAGEPRGSLPAVPT